MHAKILGGRIVKMGCIFEISRDSIFEEGKRQTMDQDEDEEKEEEDVDDDDVDRTKPK